MNAFDCVDDNKLENSSREGNSRPPYLPTGNLYSGEEATVRIGNGTMDWFPIGKGVRQGCILSPCLFNSYAENIRWNAGLDDTQARIKIADDTTLIAESEDELKSLLMKMKEESEEAGLYLNIQKTKIMVPDPTTS